MSEKTPLIPAFPTMLRRMWSGGEVEAWIKEHVVPVVDALVAERDEADRRAGSAERRLASEKDTAFARSSWLSKAKREAGYDDRVSFDDVWKEALLALQEKRERTEAK